MEYIIREIEKSEYSLLDDFLYEAIFIPDGVQPPEKDIINLPELQVYVTDFGKKKDDICFLAEVNNKVIGAVWVRDMNDYGHFAVQMYLNVGFDIIDENEEEYIMLCRLR